MNNNLKQFQHEEFGSIRAIEINGEPWFLGNDVAMALGYTNPRKALHDHVDSKDKNTVTIRDGIPGNLNETVINEYGLYSLILSSKLPAAKKFRRWVTTEILPSIRKHGAYVTDGLLGDLLRNPDLASKLLQALQAEQEKNAELEIQVATQAPKARCCESSCNAKTSCRSPSLPRITVCRQWRSTAC